MPPKPNIHPVDLHVGARIRMQRNLRRASQSELAQALGLTFQQIQKYERGANRVSASMLFEAAQFLNVPVAMFFEGLPDTQDPTAAVDGARAAMIGAFLSSGEGVRLAELVPQLPAKLRRQVLTLVEALADETAKPATG